MAKVCFAAKPGNLGPTPGTRTGGRPLTSTLTPRHVYTYCPPTLSPSHTHTQIKLKAGRQELFRTFVGQALLRHRERFKAPSAPLSTVSLATTCPPGQLPLAIQTALREPLLSHACVCTLNTKASDVRGLRRQDDLITHKHFNCLSSPQAPPLHPRGL